MLIAAALLINACSGGAVPSLPTSASPVTITASVEAQAADASVPPEPIALAPPAASGTLASLAVEPARIRGGETAVGTVVLLAPAPAGGVTVALTSSDRDVRPPASITIAPGQTIGMFQIPTSEPHADTEVRVTATAADGNATIDILLALPAPGAHTDNYTVSTGTTLVVPSPGVLDNDVRRRGHELTATLVTNPINGVVTLAPAGGFTYRANPGFSGRDRFIYRAMDGATGSNLAHVWIEIAASMASGPAPRLSPETFEFSGAAQSFVVPDGVTRITVEAYGAQGGNGTGFFGDGGAGGLGGAVTATLTVTPGETLVVMVGGAAESPLYTPTDFDAPGGYNGGGDGGADITQTSVRGAGGGGASDVRRGAGGLADRIVVAGGGGGGGGGSTVLSSDDGGAGGGGGGLAGAAGAFGVGSGQLWGPGGGGTQVAGGAGGNATADPDGAAGTLGAGGAGAAITSTLSRIGGGGGGGGFFGGGGGESNSTALDGVGGGGGGGSSFTVITATGVTHQQGVRSGNGLVVIRW